MRWGTFHLCQSTVSTNASTRSQSSVEPFYFSSISPRTLFPTWIWPEASGVRLGQYSSSRCISNRDRKLSSAPSNVTEPPFTSKAYIPHETRTYPCLTPSKAWISCSFLWDVITLKCHKLNDGFSYLFSVIMSHYCMRMLQIYHAHHKLHGGLVNRSQERIFSAEEIWFVHFDFQI